MIVDSQEPNIWNMVSAAYLNAPSYNCVQITK